MEAANEMEPHGQALYRDGAGGLPVIPAQTPLGGEHPAPEDQFTHG